MTGHIRSIGEIMVGELDNIIRLTAAQHNVTVSELLGPCREKELVQARWRAMQRMRERGYTLNQIGRKMRRDHTTVMHALRQVAP